MLNISNLNNSLPLSTNYTVNVSLDTASLISAGKMAGDCDDLWVYNGTTSVNRFVEQCNTTTTAVYFRLQSEVPASTNANQSYELVYGSSTANTPSNDTSLVFWFYDGFSTFNSSQWLYSALPSVVGGSLNLSNNSNTGILMNRTTYSNYTQLEFAFQTTNYTLLLPYYRLGWSFYNASNPFAPSVAHIPFALISYVDCAGQTPRNRFAIQSSGEVCQETTINAFDVLNDTPKLISVRHTGQNISLSSNLTSSTANLGSSGNLSSNKNQSIYLKTDGGMEMLLDWVRLTEYITPFSYALESSGVSFNSQAFNATNQSKYVGVSTVRFYANFSNSSAFDTVVFNLNGATNYTATQLNSSTSNDSAYFYRDITGLSALNYSVSWWANDSGGKQTQSGNNTFGFTKNVTQSALLTIDGLAQNKQIVYGTAITSQLVCSEGNALLYRNTASPTLVGNSGTAVSSETTSTLAGGTHNYTGECLASVNFTTSNSSSFTVEVQTSGEGGGAGGGAGGGTGGAGGGGGGTAPIVKVVEEVRRANVWVIGLGGLFVAVFLLFLRQQGAL